PSWLGRPALLSSRGLRLHSGSPTFARPSTGIDFSPSDVRAGSSVGRRGRALTARTSSPLRSARLSGARFTACGKGGSRHEVSFEEPESRVGVYRHSRG